MQQTQQTEEPQKQEEELSQYEDSNLQMFDRSQGNEPSRHFKHNLRQLLGEDWNDYASKCILSSSENLRCDYVFDTLIGLWVEYLKLQEQDEQEGFKQFYAMTQVCLQDHQIDDIFFKPVLDGFFYSAILTQTNLQPQSNQSSRTGTSTPEEPNYQIKPTGSFQNIVALYYVQTTSDYIGQFLDTYKRLIQDFMDGWVKFRQQNNQNLCRSNPNRKYVGPTQFIFNTIANEWKQINKEPSASLQEEEQKFKLLFENVSQLFKTYYDQEIVEKATQIFNHLSNRQSR